MREPAPPDPTWPRYSRKPLPPYRFVPGRSPHPRRDPRGHSYGQAEPRPEPVTAETWRQNEWYLYGIDLYNRAFWWECHEALEGLWRAADRDSPLARFLQGLIQVSAANLQRFMGNFETARGLAEEGLQRHEGLPPIYLGVDVRAFADDVRAHFDGRRDKPALIRLHF